MNMTVMFDQSTVIDDLRSLRLVQQTVYKIRVLRTIQYI